MCGAPARSPTFAATRAVGIWRRGLAAARRSGSLARRRSLGKLSERLSCRARTVSQERFRHNEKGLFALRLDSPARTHNMDMYGMPLRTESHTGPHPPRLPRPRERPTTYQPLHPHMQKERIASKWQTTTYHTTTLTTPNKHQEKVTGFSSGVCQSRRVKLLGGGAACTAPRPHSHTRTCRAAAAYACMRACVWVGGWCGR